MWGEAHSLEKSAWDLEDYVWALRKRENSEFVLGRRSRAVMVT